MHKIGVIGYGHIGRAIYRLLSNAGYPVTAYDSYYTRTPSDPANVVKIPDYSANCFDQPVRDNDVIVVATPYHCNVDIADVCSRNHKVYFDMTEDVHVTAAVHGLFTQSNGTCMTQCGLAPGAVSVIAADLARHFNNGVISDVEIRVGALPVDSNNVLKYHLSWSPEGLVNEYSNRCHAIQDYRQVELEPLEGYERLVLDGVEYEAFNTSGGIGSLMEMFADGSGTYTVQNVNYKTMRYLGHHDKMSFLLKDLHLQDRKDVLVDILKGALPYIDSDIVVIFVEVTGHVNGKRVVKQYRKKIYNTDSMSAIQLTTASGLCTAVHWYCETQPTGILYNHMINNLDTNPFWSVYREEK